MSVSGRVHSIQSMGTLDGPGVRFVVFLQGCNLRCGCCHNPDTWDFNGGTEVTTEEVFAKIKRLKNYFGESGGVTVSGGEPLMRPDIYELVAYAASKGLRPVFGTNGMLITKEVAQKLKDAGAMAMGISLDSLDEAKHNEFRGHPEAFARTVQGMKNCTEVGLPFQIHTTIMDWNKHEILDIIDFAVEIGAMAEYIFFLIPVGRGVYIEETAVEVMEYENLLRSIMEKQKEVPILIEMFGYLLGGFLTLNNCTIYPCSQTGRCRN